MIGELDDRTVRAGCVGKKKLDGSTYLGRWAWRMEAHAWGALARDGLIVKKCAVGG